MKKIPIEEEVEKFLETWPLLKVIDFMEEFLPLYKLYDYKDEDDWVAREIGDDDTRPIRIVQTVYIMSRLSDLFSKYMLNANMNHNKLWKRMQKTSDEMNLQQENKEK